MRRVRVAYADEEVLEQVYETKVLRLNPLHDRPTADDAEVLPDRMPDEDVKLKVGFRLFLMTEQGYPMD